MEPSYFKLCTEHTPTHLALLDEVVACHSLLHLTVLRIFIVLFESKQHDLDVLVQVSDFCDVYVQTLRKLTSFNFFSCGFLVRN